MYVCVNRWMIVAVIIASHSICKAIVALSVIERVSSGNNQKLGSFSFCAETYVISSQWIKIISYRWEPENRMTEIRYAIPLREFGIIEI